MLKPGPRVARQPSTRLGWRRELLLALVIAGLFVAYLSVELKQNGATGFPLDDPWIHLTFAKNLARGWGFAYNHGEPVAGSTAPLWTFILALVHLVTGRVAAIVVIAKLLGAAFLLASAVFASRIAARLTGSEWTGLAAGLAVATFGPMEWAMMSGMEVTLSVALTLAGIYYYMRFRTGWMSTLAWVMFGLAAWARPESLSLAMFAALDSLLRRFALKQPVTFWRGFGVWLVIVLGYAGFNYALSHSPFPETYLAKAGRTSLFAAIGAGSFPQLKGLLTVGVPSYFAGFCVHLWRANPVLALLAPVGLVGLVVSAFRRGRSAGLLIPLLVLGYVPLIGLVSPVFGAAFQNGRYIGNVTALAAVVAVIGMDCIRRWIRHSGVRLGTTALLLAAALFNVSTVSVATIRNTTRAESSINRMQVALGHWLADNTPAGAALACNDIGAIGYFSGRYIYDLTGLVTKEILNYRQDRNRDITFINDRKPDFLVIYPAAYPDIEQAPFLKAVAHADVRDNTASMFDIQPQPKTIAGFLILDIVVGPVPVTLTVFKCNWETRPPVPTGG